MIYAGFWLRLGSSIIDFLVLLPVVFLYFKLRSISLTVAISITVPYFFVWSIYNIYLHGSRGQTVGKIVTRLKVTKVNGCSINYYQAFLRHSVDLLFSIFLSIAFVLAYLSIAETTTDPWGMISLNGLLYNNIPSWGHWANHASSLWVMSELIVLLFNEKKRALHDFIAGTVVIDLRNKVVIHDSSIDEKLDAVLAKLDAE